MFFRPSGYGPTAPDRVGTDLTPCSRDHRQLYSPPRATTPRRLQLLVSLHHYNDFVAVSPSVVWAGTIKVNQEVTICDFTTQTVKTRTVVALYEFDGLSKSPVQEARR